jgi:3-isopropylmalate dehydrogenase
MQKNKRVAVIAGDGIGIEVIAEALRVVEAVDQLCDIAIAFDELPYGSEYYLKTGFALPPEERARIGKVYDGVLLGAVGDPRVPNNLPGREIVLGLRVDLDLYMNIRPVHLIDEALTPLKGKTVDDIQFTIVRENTEGSYGGIGGRQHPRSKHEVALGQMVATYRGVERVIRGAFDLTVRHNRSSIHMIHKANAIPQIYRLWQQVFREVAQEYPQIEPHEMLVDRAAMEIIRAPEQFEVMVTSNLFGDILSDLAAMVAGGLGLAASANVHPNEMVLCEPIHGSAPDIAGQGKANPMAAIMSVSLLLEYLGYPFAARLIAEGVAHAIKKGNTTRDLGGALNTNQVGIAIAEWIQAEGPKQLSAK